MNRDTVTGIVGAAVLLAAMVGVFLYERSVAPTGPDGAGGGTLVNATGPTASGKTNVGASTEQLVTINQTNLANVTFTVKWTAAAGKDTLKVTVAPSNGTGVTEGATGGPTDKGEITVSVPIPNPSTGGVLGVGDWKVTITFVSASPGTPVSPPIQPPVGTDASVSWSLTSTLQHY